MMPCPLRSYPTGLDVRLAEFDPTSSHHRPAQFGNRVSASSQAIFDFGLFSIVYPHEPGQISPPAPVGFIAPFSPMIRAISV